MPLWLRSSALGLALLLAAPALAQSPPRGPSAEGIVLRLLLGYDGKALPQPERWPLVPRLRDALKRTDLGFDVLTGDRNVALTGIIVDMAEMLEARRARVIARYRLENAERSVIVDLDANEGQWLITISARHPARRSGRCCGSTGEVNACADEHDFTGNDAREDRPPRQIKARHARNERARSPEQRDAHEGTGRREGSFATTPASNALATARTQTRISEFSSIPRRGTPRASARSRSAGSRTG